MMRPLESFWGEARTQRAARKVVRSLQGVPGARAIVRRMDTNFSRACGARQRSSDLSRRSSVRPWLQAADYPGSHVIVRNLTRADIPTGQSSKQPNCSGFQPGRRDAKVDVHYTQRKFLSKPKAQRRSGSHVHFRSIPSNRVMASSVSERKIVSYSYLASLQYAGYAV